MIGVQAKRILINADGSFTPAVLPFAGQTVLSLVLSDFINEYYFTTAASLTSSATISTSVTPSVGMKCKCYYAGAIATTTGGSTITFFGTALTQLQLNQNL